MEKTENKKNTEKHPKEQKSPLAFEDIMGRLEQISARLENNQIKLEEALSLFEEGVRLAKHGAAKLDEAEQRLEILLQKDQLSPFELDSNSKQQDNF